MPHNKKPSFFQRIKKVLVGGAKNPFDQSIFHNISLIAFFAWVGLGADGLSSSSYGPSEAFITLGNHYYLGIIVAIATALTIFIIGESYSQIVELFPSGGGGYIVATKLLNPTLGMISGAALLIDYVLTITLSIASGAEAFFSFLPYQLIGFKLSFALLALIVLIILNLRGIKESVSVLTPIFLIFVITHALMIIIAFVYHSSDLPAVISSTTSDIRSSISEIGLMGVFLLLVRAYSMGAGTYTGIEAVSNGMAVLREPRAKTAKKTMKYMMISLASVVLGLMIAYALFKVQLAPGKTLNAVLFEKLAGGWGNYGYLFILITLFSEAAILFVAAQTGFVGGPGVLSNMAVDKWVPKRFALLSDRLVSMNGILIMGISSIILMIMTNGNVRYLVVLYSINVFATFSLSQLGMVRHWLKDRSEKGVFGKLFINGIGLFLTVLILIMMVTTKFFDGGWITLFITGTLILFMIFIKRNYDLSEKLIKELDIIIPEVESPGLVPQIPLHAASGQVPDMKDRTAVFLVKDFRGIGIQTIFNFFRAFGSDFKNFIFVQVGLIDATSFKSPDDLKHVEDKVRMEAERYVQLMKRQGYHAEAKCYFGTDTIEEISKAAVEIHSLYPNSVFFGGQVVFEDHPVISHMLHNETLFAVQHKLYKDGIPLFIIPIMISYSY